MRRLLLPLLCSAGLCAQAPMASLIRQPRATAVEFTIPSFELQAKDRGHDAVFHGGFGLGLRRWDDGGTALRAIADANATFDQVFVGFGLVGEVPSGEKPFLGPRLRVGWAFHPKWALSLEGEHLERPFGKGIGPERRSALGLALTTRF